MNGFLDLFTSFICLFSLCCLSKSLVAARYVDLEKEWVRSPLYNKNEAYCTIQNRLLLAIGVDGYVIIKDGLIAAEGYADEQSGRLMKTPMWSLTKSFCAVLIGHLVDQGLLSVDSTLGDIFNADEDWIGVEQAAEKKSVTMFQLLTMTSGLTENESPMESVLGMTFSDDNYYSLQNTLNVLTYNKDLVGTFIYLSFNHILSHVMFRVSGMTPKELATQSGIFAAMGIKENDYTWDTFGADAIEGSAFGLHTDPRTLAKLGMLYMQNGYATENTSLVSSEWIAESIQKKILLPDLVGYGYRAEGYGYLWWSGIFGKGNTYKAEGFGGTYIFCFPDTNTLVTITARIKMFGLGYFLEHFFASIIMKYIDDIDTEKECWDFANFLPFDAIRDWLEWFFNLGFVPSLVASLNYFFVI